MLENPVFKWFFRFVYVLTTTLETDKTELKTMQQWTKSGYRFIWWRMRLASSNFQYSKYKSMFARSLSRRGRPVFIRGWVLIRYRHKGSRACFVLWAWWRRNDCNKYPPALPGDIYCNHFVYWALNFCLTESTLLCSACSVGYQPLDAILS